MSNVIFCKTRYQDIGYQSYNDLWNMVKWAGYPIIYVDQIDPQSDNTYIFTPMNGECINGWKNPKAEIILWQMEWQLTDEHNAPQGVSRVWCSDAAFAKRNHYEYVPMGGDSRLKEDVYPYGGRKYDVSFLSYQTPRRQVITTQCFNNGLVIAPSSGLQGSERTQVLLHSHLMLHIHQRDDTKGVAPLRWCLAAAHGLPLITESVPDFGIFDARYMMQARYETIASFTANALQDTHMLQDYASSLHQLLCVDYDFKRSVESHV
jgi:hypothetical protein